MPVDADERLGGYRVGPDVVAEDPDGAAVRTQQANGHRQGGGLARAVRADQAEERACGDLEVYAVNGNMVAEPLEQLVEL
jgi:hypothetical protein